MEIHQLRYFCAAAETGSFTRGARRERVTQPTLSQQLLKLENELGTKLFDRRGRRIQLTTSGRTFLRSAKSILNELSEAKQRVRRSSDEQQGSLAVGSTPTLTQFVLSPILRNFRQNQPSIKVHVLEDLQSRLLPALLSGSLDLALVHLPVAAREFRTVNVIQQSLYVALPKDHPLAAQKQVRLAELRHDSFLLPREDLYFRTILRDALRRAQVEPEVTFESSSLANILAMVSAGAGISLVPEIASAKRGGCSFVRVEDSPRTAIGWVMLRGYKLTPVQRLFISIVARDRRIHHKATT